MNCSSPRSSVHRILQARYWSGLPCLPPGDLPNPGIEFVSPALAAGFFIDLLSSFFFFFWLFFFFFFFFGISSFLCYLHFSSLSNIIISQWNLQRSPLIPFYSCKEFLGENVPSLFKQISLMDSWINWVNITQTHIQSKPLLLPGRESAEHHRTTP